MPELEGEHVRLQFSVSATANLLYQLDCLAGVHRCSKPVYEKLWRDELSFDGDDGAALKAWSRIRNGYQGSVEPPGRELEPLALPTPGDDIYLASRLRVAGFEADDVDAFLQRVALANSAADLATQRQVLERFLPRFERWWQSGPAKQTEQFTAASVTLFRAHDLAAITDEAAVLYDAVLPDPRVTLHPMMRPRSDTYEQTHGTQMDRHAIFEVVAGEQPAARMPVVLHEVFHHLYASMRRSTQGALLRHFVDSGSAYATVAYGLFNETMATVLGNGLVAERVDPKGYARDMANPKGLYFDVEIDAAAKASLPIVREMLSRKPAINVGDRAFVDAYVDAVAKALADIVTPSSSLRTHVGCAEPSLRDAQRTLARTVHASSVFGFVPPDEEAAEFFGKYPTLNAALFATPSLISSDAMARELIPPAHRNAVQRKARQAPFIYAAPRSNKSWLFIFVADDVAAAEALVAKFAKLPKATEGLLRLPEGD